MSISQPQARWAAVVAAIAATAAAAGCSASPAGHATSAGKAGQAGVTAAQGQQPLPASDSIKALGITLGAGKGAAAVGSPGAVNDTVTATGVSALTYTATGTDGGLSHPQGVSAAGGTVYVSNTDDNVVASISGGTTTAVTGSLEYSGEKGDGGKAADAYVSHPAGTAEDAKGDIFIADASDNVIREITPDGVIHRFAGNGKAGSILVPGYAAQTELNAPQAVAVTPDGDVLIADTNNNRVLAVTPAGKVGVVAGNGLPGYKGDNGAATSAELTQPTDAAVDGKGDVYIADASSNVIRRVDAATGVITTVAGDYAADKSGNDGLGGNTGDGGPATSAELNDPQGVAIDGDGNLFIADTFNNSVRVVTPDGTISTLWTGQNTPYAVGCDPSAAGTVYFVNSKSSTVEKGTYTNG